ncbi:TRAP transporter small permease subunit [Chloroflexota bacterium]
MLKKTFKAIASGFLAVETGCSRVAAGIIMVLMFLTTANVFGRYLFKSPIEGAFEASEVLMVGIIFLGIAYVQRLKGHVNVEVFTSWLPQRAQLGLEIFGYLVGFFIMAVIAWHSGAMAWKAFVTHDHTHGLIRIPLWPGKSLIPIGASLLCLRLIANIASNYARIRRRDTPIKINKEHN